MQPTQMCPSSAGWGIRGRVSGGSGSYTARRSTVGASYDFDRLDTKAGVNLGLGSEVTATASARYLNSTANVSAPTGGGKITAQGVGAVAGVLWHSASNFYAAGCGSLVYFGMDFDSNKRGRLKTGAAATGHSLGAEVGYGLDLGAHLGVTPHAWVYWPNIAVDDFTDAVNSRVSVNAADRLIGGIGLALESTHHSGAGEISLRGALGLQHTFRGTETITVVSGENLVSVAAENGIRMGLDSAYRQEGLSLGAGLRSALKFGTDTQSYSGYLRFGVHF